MSGALISEVGDKSPLEFGELVGFSGHGTISNETPGSSAGSHPTAGAHFDERDWDQSDAEVAGELGLGSMLYPSQVLNLRRLLHPTG